MPNQRFFAFHLGETAPHTAQKSQRACLENLFSDLSFSGSRRWRTYRSRIYAKIRNSFLIFKKSLLPMRFSSAAGKGFFNFNRGFGRVIFSLFSLSHLSDLFRTAQKPQRREYRAEPKPEPTKIRTPHPRHKATAKQRLPPRRQIPRKPPK